jgi:RNA polymerase sigma-70 factor (ECF subfamily)
VNEDSAKHSGEGEWAALMARTQEGDAAAYRHLLAAIAPYLRALAARYHRAPQDVEDSVQDILLTVHAIRHTYDPARPFKPWLVAIGRRRIFDRLRGQTRIRARETFLKPEHETFAAAEANLYEAEPDTRALREAVEQLPEAQRRAVTMLKFEEKSLKEVSAATGMSIVALKVSTHRAIKTLRKLLDGKGERI